MTHAARARRAHRHPGHRREEPGRDRALALEPQASWPSSPTSCSSATASRCVGFDVVWAERDTSSGIEVLDALARKALKANPDFQKSYSQLRPSLDFDGALRRQPEGPAGRARLLLQQRGARGAGQRAAGAGAARAAPSPARNVLFLQWAGYTGNLPVYLRSAAGAGHFNPALDFDGISRRVPLLAEFDGEYYEALSLAMVRALLAQGTGELPQVSPGFPDDRPSDLEWLEVGGIKIPVDESASALIPYRGRKGSFPYVSLADVLRDRVAPERLKGKIALVGTTAPGAAGPARDAGRSRLPRRRDPRQPDRRHPRQRDQAPALVHRGRRGGAAASSAASRSPCSIPQAVGAVGDASPPPLGIGLIVALQHRGVERRAGAAARLVAARRGGDLHHEHGLRLLRRVALQAPARRALRRVRAARAGRPDGARPRQVQHGAEKRRADDPLRGRPRLHRHLRGAEPGGAARVHQRVPHRDERDHPRPPPRHARQVHRRRDHGVLGRAGGGRRSTRATRVLAALEMQRQCAALNVRLRRARLAARWRSASA